MRAFTDNYPSGESTGFGTLRASAREKQGAGGNSRNFRPMKLLVPSCVPDATRTHAFRVYLSEALVYI